MKPAEVLWRLLRAERRALDGRKFSSPALRLAHGLNRMRKLLVEQRAPRPKSVIHEHTVLVHDKDGRPRSFRVLETKPAAVIYDYAIEYCNQRIALLLALVETHDLAKALTKLEKTNFGMKSAVVVVLEAYWRIFNRTRREPESGLAVYKEIEAMAKEKCNVKLPWESTVYAVLNRLGLPTRRGNRGPKRGPRAGKTSKKRA